MDNITRNHILICRPPIVENKMDYKKHYERLIESRRTRELDPDVYYEKHHIIPKCIGGTNKKDNIVSLTGREHYIAHWLLYRIRPHSRGLAYAFWSMSMTPNNPFLTGREYSVSSRAYEEARIALSNAARERVTGRKIEDIHLIKWKQNKNNSRRLINRKTNEEYSGGKQLWRDRYMDIMSYGNFMLYIKGRTAKPHRCSEISDWTYKEEKGEPVKSLYVPKRRVENISTGQIYKSIRELHENEYKDSISYGCLVRYLKGHTPAKYIIDGVSDWKVINENHNAAS